MYRISPVVKNLLMINVLFFIATCLSGLYNTPGNLFSLDNPMMRHLALYYPQSEFFGPYQFVTHIFMHGGITHILFNMYALWMFGVPIENAWGGKRFLFYYLFTGLGAAALHTLVNCLVFAGIASDITAFSNAPSPDLFRQFIEAYKDGYTTETVGRWYQLYDEYLANPNSPGLINNAVFLMEQVRISIMNIPTVGASGAVFGILLAFGMMYPNATLMLILPPIPIRAKWFVLGYGVIELILGVSQQGSSIAHFAHVGGMLFGYILIKYWSKKSYHR
ncbi:MAG: rhomboid family intramembrane serine protease [Prevotellaceae bacterium]|jgi:membrane associated rhomboid family serine protease|nr:rhomboid family intramembrane serine protease [Prevotellaceae bacterium]